MYMSEERIKIESERLKFEYKDEIDRIISIKDDEAYKNDVFWFIYQTGTDKDDFPIDIMDLGVFNSLFKRKDSDVDIIQGRYLDILNSRDLWEKEFVFFDNHLFKDIINQLEKGEIKFHDFYISYFYDEAVAESLEHKESVKKALFKLTVKYPYFEAKGETKYRFHNPTLYERAKNRESCITNPLTKYKVHCNHLFCLKDKKYFSKQDKLIKDFLNDTIKVAIAPEMILIPFNYKRKYYYLTVDNLGKTMILNTVNTGFMYINRQSNLYYQTYANVSSELRNDFNEFEYHFLKDLRKAMGINSGILKKIYNKPDRLKKSKYIDFIENETQKS